MEIRNNPLIPEKPSTPTTDRPGRLPSDPAGPRNLFRRLEIIETAEKDSKLSFNGGSKKKSGLKLALWTWLSATLDGLLMISISCLFVMIFSFMMKVSPTSILSLFLKNQSWGTTIGFLFLFVMWSYLIFMRVFIGASVGEWSCGLRLGQPLQRFQISYLLRVTIRTTLILMTGIVVLPLLSLLLSRDLAGELSGLKIYSLQ